jgi:hypothetical protein
MGILIQALKVNIARKARKGKYVYSHCAVAPLRDTNLPGLSC